jgi:hypothetical protein
MPAISTRRTALLWTVLLLITGAIAVAAIGLDVARRATGMEAARTSAAAVMAAKPDRATKAVVMLGPSPAPSVFDATVLESNGANYRETATHIRVVRAADATIVMGTAADLKPGAIIQANGMIDAAHTLHARQVVVLTGYVHIVR